ncbi:hypothetical protein CHARACLAT_020434 [Characodon lateralis]|uniref:Uncharacterized protein n=1 Tax=Characodon lateralis TaxID=208331 RepID=A0ABU7E685_9TELE|nr:hypothetical protein [Characodon lateralis]
MSSVTGEECQRCETEEMRDTCSWGFQDFLPLILVPHVAEVSKKPRRIFSSIIFSINNTQMEAGSPQDKTPKQKLSYISRTMNTH